MSPREDAQEWLCEQRCPDVNECERHADEAHGIGSSRRCTCPTPARSGGLMSAPKWLRPYLPNTSTRMALVSLDRPNDAHWPIRLTQIVGGKTWSISFTKFQTPTPVKTRVTAPGQEPCCRWHSATCEPPSELCCMDCTEVKHPAHADGSTCVLTPAGGTL